MKSVHNSINLIILTTHSPHSLGPVTETLPEICALDPSNLVNHDSVYKFSLENPDLFWGTLGASRLKWNKAFHEVSDCDLVKGQFSWFLGGKLNVTENCVDRQADKFPDRTALIWEKDEPGTEEKISYRDLKSLVCQMSNLLLANGVKAGDRVVLYMPVSPQAVAAMLGCARIGAVHSVVFAGFSAEALAARIIDAEASVVITADEGVRGGKKIPLKLTVDEALKKAPTVKRVFVMQRTGANVPMDPQRDSFLEKELVKESSSCEPVWVDSEHPLFMLYTSGSTGKPKGIVHSQAGYLLYASLTHRLVFGCEGGDVWGCVADIGWITGHTYGVYGPLSNGVTSVLFESVPNYPNPGRYWEMVERLRINQFYGAPTAIRLLLRFGDEWPKKYDRSSLRVLGSVGEPINHEAWEWYNEVVGDRRCMIVDTWWQTETGGICISPCPAEPGAEIKPAIAMRPFYGISPLLMDDKGLRTSDTEAYGALCLASPWPGMARTIYGDHDRFLQTYFKPYQGHYFTGDGAHRDGEGHYQITGRMDDVINVSGHRLGTAEIEDVLDEHEDVAETAVVSFPHDLKGEGIFAFVTLKERVHETGEEIVQDLRDTVKRMIASYAVPDHILVVPGLPKTRSGKIMRRILRKVARGEVEDLGDTSTLADPGVLDFILAAHKERLQRKAQRSPTAK